MEQNRQEVINRIIALRKEIGLSQTKMAEQFDITRSQYIIKVKNLDFTDREYEILAEIFDVSVSFIKTGKDSNEGIAITPAKQPIQTLENNKQIIDEYLNNLSEDEIYLIEKYRNLSYKKRKRFIELLENFIKNGLA